MDANHVNLHVPNVLRQQKHAYLALMTNSCLVQIALMRVNVLQEQLVLMVFAKSVFQTATDVIRMIFQNAHHAKMDHSTSIANADLNVQKDSQTKEKSVKNVIHHVLYAQQQYQNAHHVKITTS